MGRNKKEKVKQFDIAELLEIILSITNQSPIAFAENLNIDPTTLLRWRNRKGKPKAKEDLNNIFRFIIENTKGIEKQIAIRNAIENLALEVFLKENLKNLMKEKKEFKEFISTALEIFTMPEEGKYESGVDNVKKVVASEVFANLTSVNQRFIHLRDCSFFEDEFSQRLNDVRKKVVPTIERIAQAGYKRLSILQQITSLRQIFNTLPLRNEMDQAVISLEMEIGIDPTHTRTFYNELTELDKKYEDFFDWLNRVAEDLTNDDNRFSDYKETVEANIDTIHVLSKLLFMKGLIVFKEFGIIPSEMDSLDSISSVENPEIVDNKEIINTLKRLLDEYAEIIKKKTVLVESFRERCDKSINRYADLDKSLKINEDDTWNEVVGKAISLRDFGRLDDAKAAFTKYGEMFGESDPTARLYSQIAQKFTSNMDSLNVGGGAYIYEVDPKKLAAKNGLNVGDIVIQYNEHVINDMPDFVRADKKALLDKPNKFIVFFDGTV